MKAYVLDTHAFVWWVSRPRRLGRAAARVLRTIDSGRARAWILAAARAAGLPLITADATISASGLVDIVWD